MQMARRICVKALVLIWLLMAGAVVANGQSGPVHYTVALDKNPTSHMLKISMEVDALGSRPLDVAMPAWSPGGYFIENPWRNVQEFSASSQSGAIKFEKIDKQTWRLYPESGGPVLVTYRLYYPDYDDQDCYIRGPHVFMYAVGERPYPVKGPVSVKFEGVPASWSIETGMDNGADPTSFQAPDYDTFVDASIVAGSNLHLNRFDYEGIPYHLVFIGEGTYDKGKITQDVKSVVSYLVDMMGGAPYKKYVFFLRSSARPGAGGVEHLNSTDISLSAYDTMSPVRYGHFQFVAAHEFFHLWNVKRIRPAILGPFDYTREQNTRNLYVSEGMTSYWAAIGLRRSGLWSKQEYFDDLAKEIKQLQTSPGRKLMSVEQASWDTWNRSDAADNNSIDYYNKGELLGVLLDLEIRYRTKNQKSLLDVFLYLLKNNGLPKPGFEEKRGFRDAVELITRQAAPDNADFGDFFARYVSGVDEVPWNQVLNHAGMELEERTGLLVPFIGITTGTSFSPNFHGAPPTFDPIAQGQLAITNVVPGSAAEQAGLATGDILASLDGQRVNSENFEPLWNHKKAGTTATFTVLRGEQLLTVPVVVGQSQAIDYSIKEEPGAHGLQTVIRESWLGEKKP
jgi:predicted metalloprotease with PDZ domain